MHVPIGIKGGIEIQVVRYAITKIRAEFEYGDTSRHAAEFISKCGERKTTLREGVGCFQCEQSNGSRRRQHGRKYRRGLVVIVCVFFAVRRALRRGSRCGGGSRVRSPGFIGLCSIGRGSGIGKRLRPSCRRSSSGSLSAFFAALFEKPAGTSRKIKSKSPTPRMISRNMNLNLHGRQTQNETVRALSLGPFNNKDSSPGRKIPWRRAPSIHSSDHERSPLYIGTVHVTKEFFPRICLAGKELRRLRPLRNPDRWQFLEATSAAPLPS